MTVLTLRVSFLIMGISGIVAQILLLREFLVSFEGNELTLGVILANWLFLEAAGSWISGRFAAKARKSREIFISLQLLFSAFLPVVLYVSRVLKPLLAVPPGESVGLSAIFFSTFLILLPVAIPHGALFAFGSNLYAQSSNREAFSVGLVYILETVGTILGGLALTYLLIPHLNPFQIAFILSLNNSLISAILLWPDRKPLSSPLRTTLCALSLFLSILYGMGLIPLVGNEIQGRSVQSQWRGFGPIHSETSLHGNITVARKEEQLTFFSNGAPTLTTPVPDVAFVEDFVHFPMLFHENPRSILILSGGAGGVIHEILKHPVTRIDYAELDPLLLRLVQRFSTPLTESEILSPKVRIHPVDGRLFTLRTPERFDVVFIGTGAPQDLQTNRLFSAEFFSVALKKMNPGGILALSLPGSLTYMSKELRDLNACILETLITAFACVRMIPGDTHLYLASNSAKLAAVSAEELGQRLRMRHIESGLINPSYLSDRLDERKLQWFSQSLRGNTVGINTDLHPRAVFFSLSRWNALFSPYLQETFGALKSLGLGLPVAVLALSTLFFSLFLLRNPPMAIHSASCAILTTGLSGMVFSLAIIFSFQTFCGHLYHEIAILVAVFMAGIGLGAFLAAHTSEKTERELLLFLGAESLFVLYSLLLPALFFPLVQFLQGSASMQLLEWLFRTAALVVGLLTGVEFPIATRIYLHARPGQWNVGKTAGMLYGADLIGGFMGGLLGGIFFLPVLGMKETCLLMALMKGSSLVLFLVFLRIRKRVPPHMGL